MCWSDYLFGVMTGIGCVMFLIFVWALMSAAKR